MSTGRKAPRKVEVLLTASRNSSGGMSTGGIRPKAQPTIPAQPMLRDKLGVLPADFQLPEALQAINGHMTINPRRLSEAHINCVVRNVLMDDVSVLTFHLPEGGMVKEIESMGMQIVRAFKGLSEITIHAEANTTGFFPVPRSPDRLTTVVLNLGRLNLDGFKALQYCTPNLKSLSLTIGGFVNFPQSNSVNHGKFNLENFHLAIGHPDAPAHGPVGDLWEGTDFLFRQLANQTKHLRSLSLYFFGEELTDNNELVALFSDAVLSNSQLLEILKIRVQNTDDYPWKDIQSKCTNLRELVLILPYNRPYLYPSIHHVFNAENLSKITLMLEIYEFNNYKGCDLQWPPLNNYLPCKFQNSIACLFYQLIGYKTADVASFRFSFIVHALVNQDAGQWAELE
ncbi:hypothetical protein C8J56DRAFT_890550 [Mycena floridula]|nr:hypothetical protein C8J56DRAFT_890550 [Mycena floridula]